MATQTLSENSLPEKLKKLTPREASIVEAFVDRLIKEPRIPTGNRCSRWSFISYDEFETIWRIWGSLSEIADKGIDKSDTPFPQDTLLLLHDALSGALLDGRLSDRFTLFAELDDREGAA